MGCAPRAAADGAGEGTASVPSKASALELRHFRFFSSLFFVQISRRDGLIPSAPDFLSCGFCELFRAGLATISREGGISRSFFSFLDALEFTGYMFLT